RGHQPLPVYASAKTMGDLKRVFAYAFHEGPWPKGYFIPDPRVIDQPFTVGDLSVTPFDLPHGRTVTNGFLFTQAGRKKLAYLRGGRAGRRAGGERARGGRGAVLDALR